MKKIAVIGAGVIGINSILQLIEERTNADAENDCRIVWLYDTSIDIFGIGESTTPSLSGQIASPPSYLRYDSKDYFDATIKFGNRFVGWGKNGGDFTRYFPMSTAAIHFDTRLFSSFFIEHLTEESCYNFESRDTKIRSITFDQDPIGGHCFGVVINGESFDFVLDCSGGKSLVNDDYYFDSPFETCNTVLATRLPEPADWGYTLTQTTRNGWMFGIPLQSRRTYGYAYNSSVTTEEEAQQDFRSLIPQEGYQYNKFTWKPKFSNYVLHHSGRYARNGNALGFLDPLEALAGMYYDNVTDKMANYALGDTYNSIDLINNINSWYYQEVVGDWLLNSAWMYHFGSEHDTPFWQQVQKNAKDILNNKEINPCRLISDEQTFTDDLFNIIGDDPEMRRLFVHDLLDVEFTFDFCRDYYNFSSFTRGMSADYANKFPTFT